MGENSSTIVFEYNGRKYRLPRNAANYIGPITVALNGSEAVQIPAWLEAEPPQPVVVTPLQLSGNIKLRSAQALKMVCGLDFAAEDITDEQSDDLPGDGISDGGLDAAEFHTTGWPLDDEEDDFHL